ncbi:MAG TPA: alpha/beta fold hydrolase [Opitutaceae bacterium]|nr:alpha/beta fold hydrolase [Opitutaceae bacterium]
MAAWQELYPFESRYHTLAGGVRMHYVDEGLGDEAVLMLHGNPTWGFFYRDVVKALVGRIRCVVPDHVGMGLSDKPQDYRYTLEQRIADIGSLVATLGLKRVHLIVHDWGGAIGFGWARRNPNVVGRIVITNTAAFPDTRIPFRIAVCRWPLVGPLVVRGLNGFAAAAASMAVTRPLAAEVRAGFLAPYGSWHDRVSVSEFVRDIPMRRSHPSHAQICAIHAALPQFRDRKILIAWGERDFCFTPYFLARWREIFPSAEEAIEPEAGHYLLEDAGPSLVDRVANFAAAD